MGACHHPGRREGLETTTHHRRRFQPGLSRPRVHRGAPRGAGSGPAPGRAGSGGVRAAGNCSAARERARRAARHGLPGGPGREAQTCKCPPLWPGPARCFSEAKHPPPQVTIREVYRRARPDARRGTDPTGAGRRPADAHGGVGPAGAGGASPGTTFVVPTVGAAHARTARRSPDARTVEREDSGGLRPPRWGCGRTTPHGGSGRPP